MRGRANTLAGNAVNNAKQLAALHGLNTTKEEVGNLLWDQQQRCKLLEGQYAGGHAIANRR